MARTHSLHEIHIFKQIVCIVLRYQEPDEMDWRADYSQMIPPFVAPSSPARLWKVFDHYLSEGPEEDMGMIAKAPLAP